MGRGCSSCSKEALHRCSLPLGKSLHMREHTVPSALIQIHEHLRVNISTHGGVYTAVRQHASTGRDAPTHTHRHVHRYSLTCAQTCTHAPRTGPSKHTAARTAGPPKCALGVLRLAEGHSAT